MEKDADREHRETIRNDRCKVNETKAREKEDGNVRGRGMENFDIEFPSNAAVPKSAKLPAYLASYFSRNQNNTSNWYFGIRLLSLRSVMIQAARENQARHA